MDWKPYEPTLHRLMGFGSMLLNLRLLLEWRERRQLPPANFENPVIFAGFFAKGGKIFINHAGTERVTRDDKEYWPKPRVMDTLNDSREYDQGGTLGWFVLVALSVWVGTML